MAKKNLCFAAMERSEGPETSYTHCVNISYTFYSTYGIQSNFIVLTFLRLFFVVIFSQLLFRI